MISTISRTAVLATAVVASVSAQQAGTDGRHILLRASSFDPVSSSPEVPAALRSSERQQLHIVQFAGVPTQAGRDAVALAGGKVLGYLPENAYVVRVADGDVERVRRAATVRWVGDYHPIYRLDPALVAQNRIADEARVRYDLVVADKHTDKPALARNIRAVGGTVDDLHEGGLLVTATLTGPQLALVAAFDEVLWINEWSAPELDMNNARNQGGGNYIEAQAGYTGAGVNAHIYEGVQASHYDFTGTVTNVRSSGNAQTHGHCTAGIVFGNGSSNPSVRGMAPDAGKFYTNYGSVQGSRWQVFSDLVNIHGVSHTTASWGGNRTFFYNATSADSDDMVFDHDLAWTQSQSNAGSQDSRPEAWAKNVFSIGAVDHFDDSNPLNDSWQAGGASIGPASDGRIKPTLCAYYDQIGTSDRTGSSGYSNNDWYSNFGGTSGATPIVAGHNVIAIQMFTDEVSPGLGQFNNPLRVPNGTSHENRPHFPTLKALQVVNARQYSFTSTSNDNRREHQGWGFPNLQDMWDARLKTFLVDEVDVLVQGQVRSHAIAVASGEPSLKVCLNWSEPAGNPAAAQHLVNNLSLRVTSPSGTVYWGNNGLSAGVWSQPGGVEDSINSLECVFVQNPEEGNWNVEVLATAIVQDNHVETPVVDADYGLAVRGGTGTQAVFATFDTFGAGCDSSVPVPLPPCAEFNSFGGILTQQAPATEWVFRVPNSGTLSIDSFDLYTGSTTGANETVEARIYVGGVPGINPIATTTMTVGSQPGFYRATFATPVIATTTVFIGIDTSAGNVYLSELQLGAQNVAYERANPSSIWSLQIVRPSWVLNCSPVYQVPELDNNGLPIAGSTYDLTLQNAPATTFAVMVSGLSDQTWSGGALPVGLPGAPGCDLLVAPEALDAKVTDASGAATHTMVVPNNANLIGLEVFHQWVVLDAAANAAGLITSNAGAASIGQ